MSLAEQLINHTDEIVARWYENWLRVPRAHPEISEAALKDDLPLQLRVIGEQLAKQSSQEKPADMWKVRERLDPEARVEQEFPIEEVVQEYAVAVHTVRNWIEEREIDVPFREYSYFFAAIHELTAEAVRRFAARHADRVRQERAGYVARIMHQLRTPLSSLSLLASGLQSASRERFERNVRRISVLVDGLLRLERFRPDEVPLQPEELEMAAFVRDIVSDFEAEARRKQVALEVEIDRELRMTLDPDVFRDALGNVVQNAVKFTTHGRVHVAAQPEGDTIAFRIRDTGPGIPSEQLRSLFTAPQPGGGGGVGIGLQIAQHAAQSLGGRIDVDSEPGKGSCFTLHVPRAVAPRRPTSEST